MGIRGLTRYCKQHEEECSEKIEQLKDVTLAVDFNGFLYFVCEKVAAQAREECQSSIAWLLLGGCIFRLERWLEKWLEKFRKNQIRLIFLSDPPSCFGGEEHRKEVCLHERLEQKANEVQKLVKELFEPNKTTATLQLSETKAPKHVITLQKTNALFPFAKETTKKVLRKYGMQIKTAKREADETLADMVRTNQAYAILAEDSDFYCMRGVRYIRFDNLLYHEESKCMSAIVFKPNLIASCLGIKEESLIDLALLCSNDFTAQLDLQFNMHKELAFPLERIKNGMMFPDAAAKWIKYHMQGIGTIQNPLVKLLDQQQPGFLCALFEIYRFYGYGKLFQQTFEMKKKKEFALPSNKMNSYLKLLDRFDFPSFAIDVLETGKRSARIRFDSLMVALSMSGSSTKLISIETLFEEFRILCYYALNVSNLIEKIFDGRNGSQFQKKIHVCIRGKDFLKPLLSIPIDSRKAKQINRGWQSLMFYFLFEDSEMKKALSFAKLGKGKEKDAVMDTIFAILIIYKLDKEKKNVIGLTDRWIDVILLSAILGVYQSRTKKQWTRCLDDNLYPWQMYAITGALLEALKLENQIKSILGDKQLIQQGMLMLFSAEIVAQVFRIVSPLSNDQAMSKAEMEKTWKLLISDESGIMQLSNEAKGDGWQLLCRARKYCKELKHLIPMVIEEEKNLTRSVNTEQAEKKKKKKKKKKEDANPSEIPTIVHPPLPSSLPIPMHVMPSNLTSQPSMPSATDGGNKKKKLAQGENISGPSENASSLLTQHNSITLAKDDANASTARVELHDLIETLPVFQHRQEILDCVELNQLTVIQGETGCGKSTSVPQFLLEDMWQKKEIGLAQREVCIYVTQPRRVAAIELASTVAKMRAKKDIGKSNMAGKVGGTIGYRIGQKQQTSKDTCITYVTTGYMVERIIHEPKSMSAITHLVLDEVHERSMDVDVLLLLLKLLLPQNPHLKLIIMSATMDAKMLFKYFGKSLAIPLRRKKALFVGSKLYPVTEVFFEDMIHWFPVLNINNMKEMNAMRDAFKRLVDCGTSSQAFSEASAKIITNIRSYQVGVIVSITRALIDSFQSHRAITGMNKHVTLKAPPCILIFLPGINDINELYEQFQVIQTQYTSGQLLLYVLHSDLELEHQQQAFVAVEDKKNVLAKIILSTNIAESSVTIPDVTHVINCGIEKQIVMPDAGGSHVEVLVHHWCSRASTKQRAGRAGRVMPGIAFHLFTTEFFQKAMMEYSVPEMLRKPIDRVVLVLKAKLAQFGAPSELLKLAVDSPDPKSIEGAYGLLRRFDAVDNVDEKASGITRFGEFVCHLPMDLRLCRLLATGIYFENQLGVRGCLADIVILVSILSLPDLFVVPSRYHIRCASQYMREMKANLRAKIDLDDGLWSEPLAMWRFYKKNYLAKHRIIHVDGKEVCLTPPIYQILKNYQLSFRRFQSLNFLISDLCTRLVGLTRHTSFANIIDPDSLSLLKKLDLFASKRTIDFELLNFANSSDTELELKEHEKNTIKCGLSEHVLRFLLIQNFDDNLIGGILSDEKLEKSKNKKNKKTVDKQVDENYLPQVVETVVMTVAEEHGSLVEKLDSQIWQRVIGQLCEGMVEELSLVEYKKNNRLLTINFFSQQAMDDLSTLMDQVQLNDDSSSSFSSGQQYKMLTRPGDFLRYKSFPVCLIHYLRDKRFPVEFGFRFLNQIPQKKVEQPSRKPIGQVLTTIKTTTTTALLPSIVAKKNGKISIKTKEPTAYSVGVILEKEEDKKIATAASAGEHVRCRLKTGYVENVVNWRVQKNGVKVTLAGRSLFSLPLHFLKQDGSRHVYGVFADSLFTGDETKMACGKCTLLPPHSESYYAILLLVCAKSDANVWIYVDTQRTEITAIRLHGENVVFPPNTALDISILLKINQMRFHFSTALHLPSRSIKKSIQKTNAFSFKKEILELCDDTKVLKKKSPSKTYTWQPLRVDLSTDEKKQKTSTVALRFPPFVL